MFPLFMLSMFFISSFFKFSSVRVFSIEVAQSPFGIEDRERDCLLPFPDSLLNSTKFPQE
jgi:hypothetical protein